MFTRYLVHHLAGPVRNMSQECAHVIHDLFVTCNDFIILFFTPLDVQAYFLVTKYTFLGTLAWSMTDPVFVVQSHFVLFSAFIPPLQFLFSFWVTIIVEAISRYIFRLMLLVCVLM